MNKTEFVRKLKYLFNATGKNKGFNVEASEATMYYKNVLIDITVEKKETSYHHLVVKIKNLTAESDKEIVSTYSYYKGIDDDGDIMHIAYAVQKNINEARRIK
jgi:hypothetical protein